MNKWLSSKIASDIGRHLNSSAEEVEVYAYGLENFLNNALELLLLFVFASLLGLLMPTFLVLTAYGLIRVPGGGAHFKTFPRCLTSSLLLMLGLAKLSGTFTLGAGGALLSVIMLAAGGLAIIRAWVPAGTDKKRVTAAQEIRQQKSITSVTLLVNVLSAAVLHYCGYGGLANAILLGWLCGLLVITPWGYKLFHALDQGIDTLERRCAI